MLKGKKKKGVKFLCPSPQKTSALVPVVPSSPEGGWVLPCKEFPLFCVLEVGGGWPGGGKGMEGIRSKVRSTLCRVDLDDGWTLLCFGVG